MKKYTLQTVTQNEDVVAEDELLLEESDTLIHIPPADFTMKQVQQAHNIIQEALKNNAQFITILPGSKIQVLKIK